MESIKIKQIYCIKCGQKQKFNPFTDQFTCEKCQQSYAVQRFGGIVFFVPVKNDDNKFLSRKQTILNDAADSNAVNSVQKTQDEIVGDWPTYEEQVKQDSKGKNNPPDIPGQVCKAIKKSRFVTETNGLLPFLYMAYLQNGSWTGDRWLASLVEMKENDIISSLNIFFGSDELSFINNNFFLRKLPNLSTVNEIRKTIEKNLSLITEENQTDLIRMFVNLTEPVVGFDFALRLYLCSENADVKEKALDAALVLAENFSKFSRWEKYVELHEFLSETQKEKVDFEIDVGLQSLLIKANAFWHRDQEDMSNKSSMGDNWLHLPLRLAIYLSLLGKLKQNRFLPPIIDMINSINFNDLSVFEPISVCTALRYMGITELDSLFNEDTKAIVLLGRRDLADTDVIEEILSNTNLGVFFKGEIAYRLILNKRQDQGFEILDSLQRQKDDIGGDLDHDSDLLIWTRYGLHCLPHLPKSYQNKFVDQIITIGNIRLSLSVASYLSDQQQDELIENIMRTLDSLTEIPGIEHRLIPLACLSDQRWRELFSAFQTRCRQLANTQIMNFLKQFEEEQLRESEVRKKENYQEESYQDPSLVRMIQSNDLEGALGRIEEIAEYETWGRKYPRASILSNLIPYITQREVLFHCLEVVEEMKAKNREGIRMAKIVILSRLASESQWADDWLNYYLESFLPSAISEYDNDPECLDRYPKSVLTVLGKSLPLGKWGIFHRILNEYQPFLRLRVFENLFSELPKKFIRQVAGFYAYLPYDSRSCFFGDFFKAITYEYLNQKTVQSLIIPEFYINLSDKDEVEEEILGIENRSPENEQEFNFMFMSDRFQFQEYSLRKLSRKYFELWQHENAKIVHKELETNDIGYLDYSALMLHNLYNEAFQSAGNEEAISMGPDGPLYILRQSILESIDDLPRIYYSGIFRVAADVKFSDARRDLLKYLFEQDFKFTTQKYHEILLSLLHTLSERPLDEFLGDLVTMKPLFRELGGSTANQNISLRIKDLLSDID